MRFSVTEIKDTYTNTGVLVLNDCCITAVLYFQGGVCICFKYFDGIVVIIISVCVFHLSDSSVADTRG